MRNEPILFVAVALFAGYYAYSSLGDSRLNTRTPRAKTLDYESLAVPDIEISRAPDERTTDFGRDLFSPPRDTSPLPQLALEMPPLESLGALAPPTAWGPAPPLHAKFLRVSMPAAEGPDSDGLFDERPAPEQVEAGTELDPNDPEQRAARIAGFKRQYDWLDTGGLHFGQIRNADRFRLDQRATETISFFPVDPVTGKGLFGQAVEYKRSRLEVFGFAETPANELELARVRFGDTLTATDFDRALSFADRCIELRNVAPRGLKLAEEMYTLAEAINLQQDPRAQLGLARCYELGFRFEDAHQVYASLIAGRHATNARVHARQAELLARFRMDLRAEAGFERALRLARSDWEVRWRFGRFLLERGRVAEALEHLAAAADSEPRGEGDKGWRVRLRTDHAGALLANGLITAAQTRFTRALSADLEDSEGRAQIAVAGLVSTALLEAGASGSPSSAGNATPDAGFDLLLAAGLTSLASEDWPAAAASLLAARDADPFRSFRADAALSFLAERVGQPEAAFEFIGRAFEAQPTDPWILYQRGRLLNQSGDGPGALESFRAALDRELDYVPALEEMGALLVEAGDAQGAERYFERALGLEPERGVTWSRRGFNFLRLGDLEGAADSFDRARRVNPGLTSAAVGQAWWSYATGDSREAETLLAQLVDDRRSAPPGDAVRSYAETQGDRIRDHESKEIWRDRFDRQPGRIANDWRQEEGFGPETLLRDGQVIFEGQFDRRGRTRVYRQLAPERFLSFFCDVTVSAETKAEIGLFLSLERTGRAGVSEVTSEVVIGRHREGKLQALVRKSQNDDASWFDLPAGPSWPVGKPIRIGLERVEEGDVATFTLYVDGEPVAIGLPADTLSRARQAVNFGIFVESDAGRRVSVTFDSAEVIRRR